MGLSAWLGFRPAHIPPQSVTSQPIFEFLAAETMGKTPEQLWREQPYLRTVVTFLARNIAQLGLHTYRLGADDSRDRVRGGAVAGTLKRPNAEDTLYELIFGLVADLALYDKAFLMVVGNPERATGWELRRIPPRWVTGMIDRTAFSSKGFEVMFPDARVPLEVPAKNMVYFHGWNPDDPQSGVTPIEALKSTLVEQIHAQIYRDQLWRNGGRVGTYLTRPKDAPVWSNGGRRRFMEGWRNAYTGNGKKVGGVPVLEDGMEMKRVGFSAKDEDYVEGSKLALTTVASVYHVNPTMLGLLDNANYSNVKEFRKGLYGDTLGPIIAQIEARLNAFLLPALEADEDEYVEFNIREKLEGDFAEQGSQLYQAAGGPYMTRNEVRARQNLPRIEGADELIVPKNLGTPGQQGDEAEEQQPDGDPAENDEGEAA